MAYQTEGLGRDFCLPKPGSVIPWLIGWRLVCGPARCRKTLFPESLDAIFNSCNRDLLNALESRLSGAIGDY